jgi:aspartate carbamoyltransferase catalytic subunit
MKTNKLVFSSDIDKKGYDEILRRAKKFIDDGIPEDILKNKVVATLFFQPSTRSMNSVQSAIIRAGGGWIGTTDEKTISMGKGESLEDTIKMYSQFSDIIVLRHPADDSAEIAAAASTVPFMNSGSGSKSLGWGGASTVVRYFKHLGRLEGLKVGIYGTPAINRLCKDMIPVFGYYNIKLVVDDLGGFPIPKDVEEKAKSNGLAELKYDKLENFISEVDLLIATRALQKGIITDKDFSKEKEDFIMNNYKVFTMKEINKLKPGAFFDMLTPRVFEVDKTVDSDPRAIYHQYGYFVESALALMTYLMDVDV